MKVLHVVRDLDAASGGLSVAVALLAQQLARRSVSNVLVFENRKSPLTEYLLPQDGVRPFPIKKCGYWSGRRRAIDFFTDLHKTERFRLVHLHGLWNPLNHFALEFASCAGIPNIISPQGMLEPWALAQKPLKKKIALRLFQFRDLSYASCLHATAESEARSFRSMKLTNPIAVIPNGTALPPPICAHHKKDGVHRAVFLSRIHPKKGLPMLIDAWARIRPNSWECVVAGPGDNAYVETLHRYAKAKGVERWFRFLPAIQGDEKWGLLASADLFVLPTHSENFGIVVAEALASGLPVITTKTTPWEELRTKQCGWWVSNTVPDLEQALREAFCKAPMELRAMGARGRDLVHHKYTWQSISRDMLGVYEWLIDSSLVRPVYVH